MSSEDWVRTADRAAAALSRVGARLEAHGSAYAVRLSADRRRRPLMVIDEAAFAELTRSPGLSPLDGGEGAWRLSRQGVRQPPATGGRTGFIPGERLVGDAEGRLSSRSANLGESPIAWLGRRRDSHGRPWLTPAEMAAGERLREEFYRAGSVGRLTMNWEANPGRGSGGGPRVDPAERGRAAKDRIALALAAAGPGLKEILERVCLIGSALEAAERDLGLPRRSGKTLLKLALGRLARHYGMA